MILSSGTALAFVIEMLIIDFDSPDCPVYVEIRYDFVQDESAS